MIDEGLRAVVRGLLQQLPRAVEMPAGAGKTHLAAALASVATSQGSRALILTHTHTGVDAIRRQLRRFGVPAGLVNIDTITGCAFDLVRSYPDLAGITVPESPDWEMSDEYLTGAARVVASAAIADVYRLSFDFLLVDEYQDCSVAQHQFVLEIASVIPKTCVLGDRLQGIFGFHDQVLVDWDRDVIPRFPLAVVAAQPWRWVNHNEALGDWLLDIRPVLLAGGAIDLADVGVRGFTYLQTDRASLLRAALANRPDGESVLVIGKWEGDVASTASSLRGVFSVMEELQGKFMQTFAGSLDSADPDQYAALLAGFAKKCFIGLAQVDKTVLDRLKKGKAIGDLRRAAIAPVVVALDALRAEPSIGNIDIAMTAIERFSKIQIYRREAWSAVHHAVQLRETGTKDSTLAALDHLRDRLRHSGRFDGYRIVSRTVLVKGLEYDHVIVADADALKDSKNLYVALSRARKTVTVFNGTRIVNLPFSS